MGPQPLLQGLARGRSDECEERDDSRADCDERKHVDPLLGNPVPAVPTSKQVTGQTAACEPFVRDGTRATGLWRLSHRVRDRDLRDGAGPDVGIRVLYLRASCGADQSFRILRSLGRGGCEMTSDNTTMPVARPAICRLAHRNISSGTRSWRAQYAGIIYLIDDFSIARRGPLSANIKIRASTALDGPLPVRKFCSLAISTNGSPRAAKRADDR
jgi:hypothetical protein